MIGYRRLNSGMGVTCSRAVSEPNRISLLGNTLASFMPGSRVRGSTGRPTAHIQCAGRRRRRSTERLVTFERFSFCSDIRSSKAPSGISGSRWMTLSASQSRSNFDGLCRPCHLAGPQLPGRRCPELPQGGPPEQFHGSAGTAEMPSIMVYGHTCTENSRFPAACEPEFSKGPLRVSSFSLKCKSERRS